jgi:hypothetical protein
MHAALRQQLTGFCNRAVIFLWTWAGRTLVRKEEEIRYVCASRASGTAVWLKQAESREMPEFVNLQSTLRSSRGQEFQEL